MDTYEKKYNEMVQRARELHESGNTQTKKQMEIVCPELAESEDERIRDKIIWLLQQDICPFPDEEAKQMIAWLEKQKVNTEGDFGRGYDCGYQAGYAVAMNEMKPKVATATLDSEKQKELDKMIVVSPEVWDNAISDAFENGRQLGIMQEQARQELEWPDEKQKEQKPIKWTDLTWKDIVELEGIINNVHYEFRNGIGQESFGKEVLEKFREYKGDEYLDEKEQKPVEKQDYSGLNDLERAIHRGFLCAGVENVPVTIIKETAQDCLTHIKPVEWSEEDEEIFNNIIEKAKGGHWIEVNEITWLINHFKSLHPQAKQEWSEEDEKMVANLRSTLANISVRGLIKKETEQKYSAWLKSIPLRCPKSSDNLKPSENKDVYEIAYERYPINNRLVREVTKDINEDTRDGFIDGYKYCDSTHWKPGEEEEKQIKCTIALLRLARDSGIAINPNPSFGKPIRAINKCIDWLKSKLNGDSGK